MSASEVPARPPRPSSDFLEDVEALREQARRNLEDGAVTSAYGADLERVLETLQQSLATEVICTLRYRQHHYAARGMNAEPVAAEFLQHSQEELDHAGRIAARISQLGGTPDFNPSTLAERSHSEYVEADSLRAMVVENLVAERIAVASYTAHHRVARQRRPHDASPVRGDPGARGGARRGPRVAPRRAPGPVGLTVAPVVRTVRTATTQRFRTVSRG